jgi:hypothetical protein
MYPPLSNPGWQLAQKDDDDHGRGDQHCEDDEGHAVESVDHLLLAYLRQ